MTDHLGRPTQQIRVFLVDDHPIVCSGLKAVLDLEADIDVVGQAQDGVSAQERVAELRPDVVVMDLVLPRLDGIEATQQIKSAFPDVKVLALSGLDEQTQIPRALNAGASGFMPKRAAPQDLARAIRSVARGGMFIEPGTGLPDLAAPPSAAPSRPVLSERETEVLRALAAGHSARDIGASLGISVRTLETYRARAMEKLGLKTRVDIVRHAVQQGWLRSN